MIALLKPELSQGGGGKGCTSSFCILQRTTTTPYTCRVYSVLAGEAVVYLNSDEAQVAKTHKVPD